jgi:hypothetical protein
MLWIRRPDKPHSSQRFFFFLILSQSIDEVGSKSLLCADLDVTVDDINQCSSILLASLQILLFIS